MAETKTPATYEGIMKQLEQGIYLPVYLLSGQEPYYIDQISTYIANHALAEEERDFNQMIVYGSDVDAAKVVDLSKEYPVMAQRRVVIVKEAQNIKSTAPLEKYLEKPVGTTVLVICYKNASKDGPKKLISAAKAGKGIVFDSKKVSDSKLPMFIVDYLKQKNAAIDQKSATMIADHIGSDLSRLVSELDKVLVSLPENNKKITPEIVERQIGVSKDFNAWEMRNAIIRRDIFKANQIVKYLEKNPKAESLFRVMPTLFSYFQNLMVLHYGPKTYDQNVLANFIGERSGWGMKDYQIGKEKYSAMKTMKIIAKFREIDAKLKGLDNPNTPSGDLFKELIFFILH